MKNKNQSTAPQDQKNLEEGLPAIADPVRRKSLLLGLVMLILVIVLSTAFFKKTKPPDIKPIQEETYLLTETGDVSQPPVPSKNLPPQSFVHPQASAAEPQRHAELAAYQDMLQKRLSAPLFVINPSGSSDFSPSHRATAWRLSKNSLPPPPAAMRLGDQDFSQISLVQPTMPPESDTAQARAVGNQRRVIAEGTLIHAILETAIHSDLPGYLRAMTSEPVYSEDGSTLLIPAGSRLIGQYHAQPSVEQTRIFVRWTTLITPNGTVVTLSSPGVDPLGMAGTGADHIDTHFWQRFGTSALLSVLSAGASSMGSGAETPDNTTQQYRAALMDSFAQASTRSLTTTRSISSTLTIHQGKPLMVFVAKTILF